LLTRQRFFVLEKQFSKQIHPERATVATAQLFTAVHSFHGTFHYGLPAVVVQIRNGCRTDLKEVT
jgi:hypothetical protein